MLFVVEDTPALRRTAITELGDALRVLVEHATTTEAPADDLRRAAAEIREVAELLGERVRGRSTLASARLADASSARHDSGGLCYSVYRIRSRR